MHRILLSTSHLENCMLIHVRVHTHNDTVNSKSETKSMKLTKLKAVKWYKCLCQSCNRKGECIFLY